MTSNQIRSKFIKFFTNNLRRHKFVPSASLIPENDPSSLFTSSGMQPLITYLLGEKHPLGTRLVNSQKCFRAQDIDAIGDNRHTTFFEMLGNWSFGDYFKKEQLPWNFEFLTKEIGLDPQRLYVTVFEGNLTVEKDIESINIWKEIFKSVGIQAKEGERIFIYPATKNWWSRSGEPDKMPPDEPGGPDSEVFYDFGMERKIHENSPFISQKCHPNCDCGRFLEIANSVFMQYQKQKDGSLKELTQKNVDFGGGLERLVAVTNNDPDIFNTDLFLPIIKEIESASQKSYQEEKNKRAMRIISDHLKAAVLMAKEGLEPSNKLQGYIMRRLIRRAVVNMSRLGVSSITKGELGKRIYETIHKMYDGIYFKTEEEIYSLKITNLIISEINKFEQSLNKGLKLLEKQSIITGRFAFDLLQTHGFPYELTFELATEKGQKINRDEFETEFEKHQKLSRTAAKGMFKGGLQEQSLKTTRLHTATHLLQQALREILGYHVHQKGSNITAERLRFDFSHSVKLTNEEIKKVENLVNNKINENLQVTMETVSYSQALKQGALTIPDTKYPEMVKVYSIGKFSKEVCGGPHVDFTQRLGKFKIIKEDTASSNCRRIYAILV